MISKNTKTPFALIIVDLPSDGTEATSGKETNAALAQTKAIALG